MEEPKDVSKDVRKMLWKEFRIPYVRFVFSQVIGYRYANKNYGSRRGRSLRAHMRYPFVFALLLTVTMAAPATNSPLKNISGHQAWETADHMLFCLNVESWHENT